MRASITKIQELCSSFPTSIFYLRRGADCPQRADDEKKINNKLQVRPSKAFCILTCSRAVRQEKTRLFVITRSTPFHLCYPLFAFEQCRETPNSSSPLLSMPAVCEWTTEQDDHSKLDHTSPHDHEYVLVASFAEFHKQSIAALSLNLKQIGFDHSFRLH